MTTIKQILNTWYKIPQGFRFLLVGGYNTVFGYILFSILYYMMEDSLHYSIILLISSFIGILNNFIVFKIFVFNTKGNWLKECLFTYASYSFIYPVNLLLLFVTTNFFHLSAYFGQGIATVTIPIITYFTLKKFAFKNKKS